MSRILAIAIGALLLAGCGPQPPTELSRYTEECHSRGGFVSKPYQGWSRVDFECVNADPALPGLSR